MGANFNINKSILGGRLTADPELKQTVSGISACTFTIAVNRKYTKDGQQEADFINCQAWRQTAEFICRHFKKGSSICVTGAIQTRSWTDSNNQKRYATEVVVDEAYFVDGKNDPEQQQTRNPAPYIPDAYKPQQEPKFEPLSTDSDLPF
jgi:single-strand DNA-binding protein